MRGRKRRENVDCQIHRFDDLPADMLHDSDGFRAASEGPLFSETPSCEAAKKFPPPAKDIQCLQQARSPTIISFTYANHSTGNNLE